MNKTYQSNTEPKIGDKVVFASDVDQKLFRVVSVGGGRLGNKIFIVPNDNQNTSWREYYYYCFCPII